MRKFKVGDKVVVIDAESTNAPKEMNGHVYTVTQVGKDNKHCFCRLEGTPFGIYAHGLEFETIMNTPLYEALK